MSYYKPFHRRMQEMRGEISDTFSYDFPQKVRQQIVNLLGTNNAAWDKVFYFLQTEFGLLRLNTVRAPSVMDMHRRISHEQEIAINQFLNNDNDEEALSILEVLCRFNSHPDTIEMINFRLQYERKGFRYNIDSGMLIKVEDDLFYNNVTFKTLGILSDNRYHNALEHYISSYEKLSQGNYQDALMDIGRAMESLLKTRFSENGIEYDKEKDTLMPLLEKLKKVMKPSEKEIFEPFKNMIYSAYRERNKKGGHGQSEGNSPALDEKFIRFIINQGAANLLFLAELEFQGRQDVY